MQGQQCYNEFLKTFKEMSSDLNKENHFKEEQELWKKNKSDNECLVKDHQTTKTESNKTEKHCGKFLDESSDISTEKEEKEKKKKQI